MENKCITMEELMQSFMKYTKAQIERCSEKDTSYYMMQEIRGNMDLICKQYSYMN